MDTGKELIKSARKHFITGAIAAPLIVAVAAYQWPHSGPPSNLECVGPDSECNHLSEIETASSTSAGTIMAPIVTWPNA